MTYVVCVPHSKNIKTGDILVSNSSWSTCSNTCPLIKKGCYGKIGTLAIHNKSFNNRSITWKDFCKKIAALENNSLWRHNIVGDLPGDNTKINFEELKLLVKVNRNKRGYTYTHKPVIGKKYYHNREAIKFANENGFIISLSAVGLKQADKLYDLNIAPVVVVLPYDFPDNEFVTPKGRKGSICPAENGMIQCKGCGVCAIPNRKLIIGFRAHGVMKKIISREILNG